MWYEKLFFQNDSKHKVKMALKWNGEFESRYVEVLVHGWGNESIFIDRLVGTDDDEALLYRWRSDVKQPNAQEERKTPLMTQIPLPAVNSDEKQTPIGSRTAPGRVIRGSIVQLVSHKIDQVIDPASFWSVCQAKLGQVNTERSISNKQVRPQADAWPAVRVCCWAECLKGKISLGKSRITPASAQRFEIIIFHFPLITRLGNFIYIACLIKTQTRCTFHACSNKWHENIVNKHSSKCVVIIIKKNFYMHLHQHARSI